MQSKLVYGFRVSLHRFWLCCRYLFSDFFNWISSGISSAKKIRTNNPRVWVACACYDVFPIPNNVTSNFVLRTYTYYVKTDHISFFPSAMLIFILCESIGWTNDWDRGWFQAMFSSFSHQRHLYHHVFISF